MFCQAGQIYIPRQGQLLLGYLENVGLPGHGPARWGVSPETRPCCVTWQKTTRRRAAGVHYRVLCSSRNLTFDRSWDTLLVLEGPLAERRKNAFARNHPLARFVAALPGWVVDRRRGGCVGQVHAMADELLRVDFECPEGFDDFAFCPVGMEGAEEWPVLGHRRTLTISPFVQDGFIRRLAEDGGEHQLVSRIESLDGSGRRGNLAAFRRVVHEPGRGPRGGRRGRARCAVPSPESGPAGNANGGGEADAAGPRGADTLELARACQLSGLHAKLFVADDGGQSARVDGLGQRDRGGVRSQRRVPRAVDRPADAVRRRRIPAAGWRRGGRASRRKRPGHGLRRIAAAIPAHAVPPTRRDAASPRSTGWMKCDTGWRRQGCGAGRTARLTARRDTA